MIIAIRKQIYDFGDGEILGVYIDKEICSRTITVVDENGNIEEEFVFSDEILSEHPYNFKKVEIDDKYADCIETDFDVETLTFDVSKYDARKQLENQLDYENKIVAEIRKKYTVNQELAILRQRDTKPEEFAEYNEYVERCKQEVKNAFNKE